MAIINGKVPLIFLLFFLIAISAYLALSSQEPEVVDPELQTCKHQCRQQQQYSESEKHKCERSCEKYEQMKKEREREIEEEIRRKKEREIEEKGGHYHRIPRKSKEEEDEDEDYESKQKNPFVFGDEEFESRAETEDGRVWVLQKFKKKVLRGIENFRLAILEAKQETFVSPCHFDSEAVFFNVKGRATIGLVKEDKTERFSLEPGDIMRVPSGTPVYVVNKDENEKLLLALLHIPLSIPGNFEPFYGAGGREPESILTTFSWEILEAAFKRPKEKLESVFGRQRKGIIFKISKEQVEALSKEREVPSIWPFGGQWRGPFNLFQKRSPTVSNDHGRLYEMGPDDQRDLENLNLMITFANITNGSMTAPMYNSKAIKIGLVIEGEGHFEMATPYVSQRHRKRSSPIYQRVSAYLRPGMVFVVPTGHPFVTLASPQNNLQILCFELNAKGNKKLTLAGKKNIVSAMDKQAKELAFNLPADKVDDVFNREEQFFFAGPQNYEQAEERGRAYA